MDNASFQENDMLSEKVDKTLRFVFKDTDDDLKRRIKIGQR